MNQDKHVKCRLTQNNLFYCGWLLQPNIRKTDKFVNTRFEPGISDSRYLLYQSLAFFNWYSGGGVQLGTLGTAATNGLLCQLPMIMMEKLVDWWSAGETKYSEKTCPSAALSTTNPTYCPDANPGRRGEKPASNSHWLWSQKYNKVAMRLLALPLDSNNTRLTSHIQSVVRSLHEAKTFVRRRQSLICSITSLLFMEPKSPHPHEPYDTPVKYIPHHHTL
jgi:hypothetical protein